MSLVMTLLRLLLPTTGLKQTRAVFLKLGRFLLLPVLLMVSLIAQAEIVLITSADNPLEQLSASEVRAIFLKKTLYNAQGQLYVPVMNEADKASRQFFLKYVLKKTEGQLNAYWARRLFTNSAVPPQDLQSLEEFESLLRRSPNALTFADSDSVQGSTYKIIRITGLD